MVKKKCLKKLIYALGISGLVLSMTACAGGKKPAERGTESAAEKNQDEGSLAAEDEKTEETGAPEENAEDTEDQAAEIMDVTYGNAPNNLFQLSQTPCFGDGRVYYINFNNQVSSFALDGSDARVNGSINDISDRSSGAKCLNWYDGAVYYMLTQYREDYTCYTEIRSMNPETGEEKTVEAYEGNGDAKSSGMGIIGDNLFYACYDSAEKKNIVNVTNLVSGEKNKLFEHTVGGMGSGDAVFATDGKNLYMAMPEQAIVVYKLPLAELYSPEPVCEQAAAFWDASTIFTENGIYTAIENPDTHQSNYEFLRYSDSGGNWPQEVVLENLIADGESGTEQDIVNNLIWYSDKWMLGDALASVSQMNRNLYYSASIDYTQSSSVGELDFENSAANGTGKYIGAYENVLYVICQKGEEVSFHTLTAEGEYK